ncbi:MAG TPA: ATP-binding protein [Pyrinomonadaceae bacterium]|nr:ATP-binding protein [Pyrinomonadaceae bacterium]
MDQTQREFLVEVEDLVEQIFADLDELRATRAEGQARRELIDRIFRLVHSVKGSAASSGLEVVNHIAHEFESLLAEIRAGRVLVDDEVLDTCESAAEALTESLTLAASGVVEPSYRALFERLQAAALDRVPARDPTDSEAILKNIPFEIWESLNEAEKNRLVSIAAEGSPIFVVGTSFDIGNFDAEFFRLKEKLAAFGEVISTSPAVDPDRPDKINFRILYAVNSDLQTVQTAVSDFAEVVFDELVSTDVDPAVSKEILSASPPLASIARLSNFVRTDLDRLDRLISSTHALLRATSTTLNLAMSQLPVPSEELHKMNRHIRSSFIGLEDELINLRLASLGPTLQRVARAGRAAARLDAKEINFEISGAEVRLDRLLIEAMADPLIHLVRNAVGHGIETIEERTQAGKPPRGTVRIEAVSEGSQSRLRVVDDGRGVDPQFITEAARRLGLFKSDAQLDMEQSLRLIFRPGFTTLASASDISGRGVGLDVVETAVEQVGGELRVSSKPGYGTTFEIRLPVTFGLVATNVIVSAGKHYCIPASQTLGIDAIDIIDGASGANQIPQVSMRDLLGQPEEQDETTSRLQLITCQFTDERAGVDSQKTRSVGIVVDEVQAPQEVLVRNLGRHAGRWYGIAGATELRDGTVALVLDLPRLLH